MINQNLVKRLWNEREEHICFYRYLFNEKEIHYLCAVLNDLRIPYTDCYISTKQLIREVKEGYKDGKHFRTVAKELRESNRIIAENA